MASHAKNASAGRIVPAIPLTFGAKARARPAPAQKQAVTADATDGIAVPRENSLLGGADESPAPGPPNGAQTPLSNGSVAPKASTTATDETPVVEAAEKASVEQTATPPLGASIHSLTIKTPSSVTSKGPRELPPPFYPTQGQSNPSSATSTSNLREPQFPAKQMTQNRLSANNLVFGTYRDSNSSSPAMAPPANVPAQPTPPGLPAVAFGAAPFIPTGHAYHYSEPHTTTQFAQPMGPHVYPYVRDGVAVPSPQQHQNPRNFYAPNGRGRQPGPRPDDYYAGRYMPAAPAYYPYPQPGVRYPDPNYARPPFDQRRPLEQDGISAEQVRRHDASRRQSVASPAEDLLSYLRHQFGHADFADYALELSHSEHLFSPVTWPMHGILLARSPKLRSLMAMQHSNASIYPRRLGIMISDKFLNIEEAFLIAIKRLYGEPLLEPEPNARPVRGLMRLYLAYAAAGHFLQVDEIITHGLELASRLLSWETLDMPLAFALDGGLSFSWNSVEASDDKGSSSSFEDSKLDSPASAPTYGIYSERLLGNVVQYLIANIPPKFKFTPSTHVNGRTRLSQIRFGEMSADDQSGGPAEQASRSISGILSSLPFPVLKHVLEHPGISERLGSETVAEVMHAVVEERDPRRQPVIHSRGPSSSNAHLEDGMRSSRWIEKVEPSGQGLAGFILTRHRPAVDTPTSSDSTKS